MNTKPCECQHEIAVSFERDIVNIPTFACLVAYSSPCASDRYQAELEAKVLDSEIAIQVTRQVEARVQEVMASQAVQQSLQQRLIRERKLLEEQVGFAAFVW